MPKKCKHQNIGYAVQGETIYAVSKDKDGNLDYEHEDFEGDGGEYFCRDCGKIFGNCEADIEKYL